MKSYYLTSTLLVTFLSVPLYVFAQQVPVPRQAGLQNPLKMDSLEELLLAILNLIMVLMVPVIVFFIIFAGFKYVTARGNPNTIQDATRALTYAIIGAVIILGAVAISQMVKNTVDEFRADPQASVQFEEINLV